MKVFSIATLTFLMIAGTAMPVFAEDSVASKEVIKQELRERLTVMSEEDKAALKEN